LRKAEEALNSISPTAVTGSAKARISELKQRVNALQQSVAAKSGARATSARGSAKWATDVAAIDRLLTDLLATTPSPAAGEPGATGTSGVGRPSQSKAAATVNLDEQTRGKLLEVRTHITAFAAAMSGTAQGTSPATPAAGAASATPSQPPTSATQPQTSEALPPKSATQPPTTTTEPPISATQPAQASSQQPVVDKEAAKQHLTAARNTLSQLTQLPAASQLTGDARTQVSQLIANFNELITTDTEWRAAYQKVEANLTALIGAQTTDESPTPTTGTAGAVGTAGTLAVSLDPAIRAKLVEFRNHLNAFEKAAGGVTPPAGSATGTSGSTSGAMTTGTQTGAQPAEQMGHEEALRHIQAIEAILSGTATAATTGATSTGTTGTTGSTTSTSGATLTLDRTQLEQLRMHLNELKRLIGQAKK
jgi:hypothetical protein